MTDLVLDASGDLDVTPSGDIHTHTDLASDRRQHLSIRLKFVRGEWFRNTLEGVPYFQSILVKNPDLGLIGSIFRKVILSTPGVVGLSTFDPFFDTVLRRLSLSFDAKLEDGQTLTFSDFVL